MFLCFYFVFKMYIQIALSGHGFDDEAELEIAAAEYIESLILRVQAESVMEHVVAGAIARKSLNNNITC